MNLKKMNLNQLPNENKIQKFPYKKPSLIWCIIKVSYRKFLTGSVLKLVYDLVQFSGPIILK